MRKLFLALLVCIIGLTFASMNAQAEDEPIDSYTWFDEYEDNDMIMMYPRKKRENFGPKGLNYGYSGVDVVLGDWVYTVARGNVFTPNKDNAYAPSYGSFGQLYYNDTDTNWEIPRTIEAAFFILLIDDEGKVYHIDNSNISLSLPTPGIYDVWWDSTANEMKSHLTGASHQPHDPHQLQYKELKGGTLGTYPWLTKATVDENKADGITFADDDYIYQDADGKYTNADGEFNTKVNNDDKGFVIPSGHYALAFEYLDRVDWNNADYFQKFHNLVNGEAVAEIKEHDVTPPTIMQMKAGKKVAIDATATIVVGDSYEPEIVAEDSASLIDGDDSVTVEFTTKYYTYNAETDKYDIEAETLDTSKAKIKYRIVYSAEDELGNKFTTETMLEILSGLGGIKDKTFDEGAAIDLLEGVVAYDDDGTDLTSQIALYTGGLDVNNPKPGVYDVLYLVTNKANITLYKSAKITILDITGPVIIPIEDIKIDQGVDFDLKSPVIAYDNLLGDVDIVVQDDDDFDKDYPGVYDIVIDVYDENGNKSSITYKIEVIKTEDTLQGKINKLITDFDAEISALETEIENIKTKLGNLEAKDTSTSTEIDNIKKDMDNLDDQTTSKDKNNMIFTIIVAALSVGGVSVGLTSLFKKQ